MSRDQAAATRRRQEWRSFITITAVSWGVAAICLWLLSPGYLSTEGFGGRASVLGLRLMFILAACAPLFMGFMHWGDILDIRKKERKDEDDAYKERQQLRKDVANFYHDLDDEYRWLLDESYSWDEQRRWVNQPGRFVEVIDEWRKDKERFSRLRADAAQYRRVLLDLERESEAEPVNGVPPFSAQRLSDLWEARMDLFRYARTRSRRAERARVDMDEKFEEKRAELDYDDSVDGLIAKRSHERQRRERNR